MPMEICQHNFQIDVNELVSCANGDMPTTNTWKVHIEDFTKLKNTLWAEF